MARVLRNFEIRRLRISRTLRYVTAPVEKIHAGWTIRLAHSCSPIIVSRWLACSIHCYACVCCVLVSVVLLSNLLFAKLCIYTVTNVVVYYNVHYICLLYRHLEVRRVLY